MKVRLLNAWRLGMKELLSLWNDKVLLIMIVWAFSGGIYTASTATSQELHNAPIAIVDEDQSVLSSRIAGSFYGPYFKPPDMITESQVDAGLDAGIYTFVLNIPPDFERDVLAGQQPVIQVNIDAMRVSQAFIGAGYIQNIVLGEVGEFVQHRRSEAASPITLAPTVMFNPNMTSSWFGSVMEIINNVTMLSVILTGAALIREREHGTLEHLLVMPLGAFEIMLAKVWSMALVVWIAVGLSLYFVVGRVLDVPIAGSIPLFMAGTLVQLLATTSLGIFIGTLSRNMPQLGLMMILVVLPLQLLSGGMTPRESMPEVVQNIMLFAPTTHFVSLAQAVLYRGAGLDVVWPSLLAMAGIALAFFVASLLMFRRSIAAQG
ncbi:ABC transporter permease [Methyloversatilis sp.]|uniref:ABC-2 transporter permease n=1 Tax=Methyloversatilis sp. TaxID=2569862 RepID=UPI002732CD51|nr:ABC transporter permease [Methyloversatilis sp.]MDP2867990.1 ABC transporter permease [Methyloversatilis sp.]MDP3454925.1 ABC transporter permease [Methyloversatilis sp.]MDP3577937.1 ABC transporter permease [Methyloversatilis sp.]